MTFLRGGRNLTFVAARVCFLHVFYLKHPRVSSCRIKCPKAIVGDVLEVTNSQNMLIASSEPRYLGKKWVKKGKIKSTSILQVCFETRPHGGCLVTSSVFNCSSTMSTGHVYTLFTCLRDETVKRDVQRATNSTALSQKRDGIPLEDEGCDANANAHQVFMFRCNVVPSLDYG